VFAQRLARSCAEAGFIVISGGARGVDSAAQDEAIEAGGRVVAVLAESLERAIQKRAILAAVRAGTLTLLTPFHPATPFSVGVAMARNRLVYCLSDAAVVVSSSESEGGTWAGAVENLERGWVALYVRSSPGSPSGNRALVSKGGRPLTAEQVGSSAEVATIMDALAFPKERGSRDDTPAVRDNLFEVPEVLSDGAPPNGGQSNDTLAIAAITANGGANDPSPLPSPDEQREGIAPQDVADAYGLVIDRIRAFCRDPRTAHEIAAAFAIEHAQANAWLARAVKEGALQKRTKPVRYVVTVRTLFTS
jgi:predicted Rossmann fold nucleotide-binding protein DprA/Smf involved in DNA uptake